MEQLSSGTASLNQRTIELLKLCERHEPLAVSRQGTLLLAKSIETRRVDFRAELKEIEPSFTDRFHDSCTAYGTYRLSDLVEAL